MRDAPVAPKKPRTRSVHGDDTVDEYYWLLDRDDADPIAYLEAENDYTEAMTEHLGPLRDRLFDEIKARVQETDLSVPTKRGPGWYGARTEEGKQSPIFCRRSAPTDERDEQVLIDGNELAGDSPYFALGVADVSPDHTRLAFSTDYDGNESFTLRFKDLTSGEMLPDEVEGTYYGSAWAPGNATFFSTTLHQAPPPHPLRTSPPAPTDSGATGSARRAATTSSCTRRATSASSSASTSRAANGS